MYVTITTCGTVVNTPHNTAVSRDGTARLWDCGSASCLGTIASTDKPIYSCSISASDLVGKRNPTQPLGNATLPLATRYLSLSHTDPECGTNDKLVALACGDRYLRGVDIRSRKKVALSNPYLGVVLCTSYHRLFRCSVVCPVHVSLCRITRWCVGGRMACSLHGTSVTPGQWV